METFADKLKRMREEKSLSQQELAQKIFVSRSAVAKWEQGRGFPSVASLQYIAAEFGVTIDELVSDKEIAILEIQKDKKLSLRTKLLIAMSVILSVIIAIGAVLLGMFYPRRLSKYIDLDADAVDAVIVHYVLHGENEDGEFSETVYLDLDKIDLFVYYVKNIKVIPEYIAYKCKTSYYFDIYTNGKIYRFSSRSLTIWENGNRIKIVRFRIKDGNDGSLLILFGIKPNGD